MDKTSMTLGWLVGRQIAGHRRKKGTLVGYSYNGVILPALPEWDREEYPYAFMHKAMRYQLWVGKEITYNGSDIGIAGAYLHCFSKTDGWNELPGGTDVMVCDISKVEWANFDVLDENGAVVLNKSDPIPVYE